MKKKKKKKKKKEETTTKNDKRKKKKMQTNRYFFGFFGLACSFCWDCYQPVLERWKDQMKKREGQSIHQVLSAGLNSNQVGPPAAKENQVCYRPIIMPWSLYLTSAGSRPAPIDRALSHTHHRSIQMPIHSPALRRIHWETTQQINLWPHKNNSINSLIPFIELLYLFSQFNMGQSS